MTREPTLGATSRATHLASLANDAFDVLVLGGGIGGACAAWDAALRGLKVALVERLDFGAGTSAHSFKILHGGIRYLQHLDLPRLRESCHERGAFLRIAPHLTQPLPIAVPTFGYGMQSRWLLATAFVVLESLTLDRNRGLADRARAIPSPYLLSRAALLDRFPGLRREGLTGAGVFYDGQIRNPPRTVLAVIRAAAEAGAVVANYCEAERLIVRGNEVCGAEVHDLLSGARFAVRAAVTVNATGPFAPDFLHRLKRDWRLNVPLSRDMAIVVRRQLDPTLALAVQTRYADPDAVLSRGNRHLFLAPWRGRYTLIGVSSRIYTGSAYELMVTEAEVAEFVNEINEAYPGIGLKLSEVASVNAGLLPFGENAQTSKDLSFGKRSVVIDHLASDGLSGLVTGMSIRWTMGRLLGQEVINLAERKLRGSVSASRTDRTPVWGGDIESMSAVEQEISSVARWLSPTQVTRIASSYGADWRRVVLPEQASQECIAGSDYLISELQYAVRHELAATLADVVLRRLDLGSGEQPADATLAACADIVALELGWDAARRARELDRVRASYPFAGPQSQYPVSMS
jgi:glycerol-3-phosphate dehydrogenase